MTLGSASDRHEAAKMRSEQLLQTARAKKRDYNSDDTRRTLRTRFAKRSRGRFEPYEWQLDVAEALLLGLDSVVIAGTGSGKTIPFMLPLLLHPEKMVLILSPLKILQRDQRRRFKKMRIPAHAVNGDTWSSTLATTLNENRRGAVLTSPEMCLKHPDFRKWLTAKETAGNIMAIIVDEAHCISQWGGDFRPVYSQLEKLRAFMPPEIPILLTSATLPPAALKDCCSRMLHPLQMVIGIILQGSQAPDLQLHGNISERSSPSLFQLLSALDFQSQELLEASTTDEEFQEASHYS